MGRSQSTSIKFPGSIELRQDFAYYMTGDYFTGYVYLKKLNSFNFIIKN